MINALCIRIAALLLQIFIQNPKVGVDQSLKYSDAVFVGKVLSVDTFEPDSLLADLSYDICVFKVCKIYKGKKNVKRIVVYTNSLKRNLCMGFNFEVGKCYTVHSVYEDEYYNGDKKRKKFLYTSNCMRTTEDMNEIDEIETYLKNEKQKRVNFR